MRDILIALCGLTPQVITETIWALGHRKPPVLPEEIWVLTTAAGKDACARTLLGKTGAVSRYWKEFHSKKPLPRFGRTHIITLTDARGVPLDDLRSDTDNQVVADQIAEEIRRHTRRPEVRLHCSVAGGRKTMGILLSAALQLYGRPEDRLYHVLVSPEFETHPQFFYTPRRSKTLSTPDGRILRTKDATIELAEIPYVRLREVLSHGHTKESLSFTQLVARTQRQLEAFLRPKPVGLHEQTHELSIGEHRISMPPSLFAVYAALARIKTRHCVKREQPSCEGCTACFPILSPETWETEQGRLQNLAQIFQSRSGRGFPKTLEQFRSAKAKIHKALRQGLGSDQLADRYGITVTGERYAMAYGLAVDKTAIQGEEPNDRS